MAFCSERGQTIAGQGSMSRGRNRPEWRPFGGGGRPCSYPLTACGGFDIVPSSFRLGGMKTQEKVAAFRRRRTLFFISRRR